MRKLLSLFTALLFVGSVWGATKQLYLNEGAVGTVGGVTATGNINTTAANGNPAPAFGNTSAGNKTFTFTGFSVSDYSNLELSIDAAFKNFPSTTNTWPYATVTFYKNDVVVKTDNTTIKWSSKVNTYSTYTIENIPDFDKIVIEGSPAVGKTGGGKDATNYGMYLDNITLTGEAAPVVSVDPSPVAFGDVKQHSRGPLDTEYIFKSFTVTGANLDNNITVNAPSGSIFDLWDVAEESVIGSSINLIPDANGSVEKEFAIMAATGWSGAQNGSFTIEGNDLDDDITINITMNVTPTFEVGVDVNDDEMGMATINGQSAVYTDGDDVLNIVATPKPGYEFVNWTVSDGDVLEVASATSATTTVTAIAAGTITANFKVSTTPIIEISETALDWGSVAVGTALTGKTFAITGLNLTANVALAWDGEGDDAFTYEVTTGNLTPTDGAVSATITVTPKVSAVGSYVNELTVSSTGATSQAVDAALTILQTYTAKWYVNGEELTESTQNAVAGTDLEFPSDPAKLSDDCAEMVFKGWAEAAIVGKQDDAPTYTTKTKMPEADVNFYAVFASEVQSGSIDKKSVSTTMSDYVTANGCTVSAGQDVTMYTSLTLDENITLSTTGEANCGSFWNTSNTDDTKQWRLYQNKSGNATVTALNGYELKNVTITYVVSNTGTLTGLTSGEKTEVSGTSVTYNVGNTGSATNGQVRITAIEVEYEKNDLIIVTKDYLTTCPSCPKVTLEATEAANGTVELSSYLVQTCEAAEVTVTTTPATGYELSNIAISELSGASISGNTISLAAETAGELTVTATFTKINYTVTMAQTGGASATMSADQTNKHFNDEITVSTNEPAGYAFLGWTASSAVEFADAKALETTFNLPNGNITVTANFAKRYTVAEAIYAIDNDGVVENVVVEGYVNNDVTASSTGSLNYYIQDVDANGFLTGTTFEAYKGKNIENVNFNKDEGVKLGAKVRIYGNIKYYQKGDQYELDQNNYLLSYNEGTYDGVEIYGSATTTTYDAGDEFSTVGLNAKDVWDNGYAEAIAYADVEWAADPTIILANTPSVAVTATYDDNTSAPYNVNVTVNTYAVTFDAPEYGTLVVKNGETPITSGDEFVKGTVLTVVATPESGYQLATLTAGGKDISSTKSFTIGTADVEVVATFSQATALDNTELDSKAVKVMRNGILYIEKNGKTYNAQGQLVK